MEPEVDLVAWFDAEVSQLLGDDDLPFGAGVIADAYSIEAAIWTVAVLTGVSGLIVMVRMYETHPRAEGNAPAT